MNQIYVFRRLWFYDMKQWFAPSIITVWLTASMIFSGQLYKFKAKESEEGELLCGPELHAGEQMSTVLFQVEMIVGVVIT